jgi:hypothetical protein
MVLTLENKAAVDELVERCKKRHISLRVATDDRSLISRIPKSKFIKFPPISRLMSRRPYGA